MSVNMISPSMLLYEDVRNDIFNQALLRPLPKRDDIIWRQMTWEHFEDLVKTKKLHFGAYSEYDDYDEKKLPEFVINHSNKKNDEYDSIDYVHFKKVLTDIERRMLVSCWYNSKDLSDIVFKQYTRMGSGIAIGTQVDDLIACFDGLDKNDCRKYEFYAGNVQYIPQKDLEERPLFEETQIIAPVFLKGLQFRMDNEFRVCAYSKGKPLSPIYNSDYERMRRKANAEEYRKRLLSEIKDPCFLFKRIEELELELKEENKIEDKKEIEDKNRIKNKNFQDNDTCFHIQDMGRLIKYVAIINSGLCAAFNDNDIIMLFKEHLNINLSVSDMTSSGFKIYNVDKIGEWQK